MKHKYLLTILFILSYTMGLFSQQNIILTRYTFNNLFFNAASAGAYLDAKGSLTAQYRNQWAGIEGAPTTLLAGGDYLFEDYNVGVGLTLAQDGIGIDKNSSAALSASYRIKMSEGFLSGGIRAGYNIINADFSALNVKDGGDFYSNATENINIFSTGFGLMYYDKVMNVGISIPELISTGSGRFEKTRHVFAFASVMVGDEYSPVKIKPSLLVKYEQAVPLQITLGGQVWLTDFFAPGLYWRVGESIALGLELVIDEDISITAAYDFSTTQLNDYTLGSMEVMVGYKIGRKEK